MVPEDIFHSSECGMKHTRNPANTDLLRNLSECAIFTLSEGTVFDGINQGSPPFFKLRATFWGPINAKGYQFDVQF